MPRLIQQFFNRLSAFFKNGRKQSDLDLEIQGHIEMMTEENIAAGISSVVANKKAMKTFGSVEKLKEDCRDSWGGRIFSDLMRDMRYSFRLLVKGKGYSIAVIATLALCVGGNASLFTMLNTILLRPLPFPESERIVSIYNSYPNMGMEESDSNVPMYLDFRDETNAFSSLALIDPFEGNVGGDNHPERVFGFSVTADFFPTIGVNPELGVFFSEESSIRGQHRVVVLSHRYWKGRYHSAEDIVNQSIQINGSFFEVLGVAPRSLEALYPNAQMFVAYSWDSSSIDMRRHSNDPSMVGRLKPGVSIAMAKSQVDARDQVYLEAHPELRQALINAGHETRIEGLQGKRTKSVRGVLYLLQVGGIFVWLIGCVNISNLALTRANARKWEFALRKSFGARGLDLGRQLYSESFLLSVAGAVAGSGIGLLGIKLINTYAMDMLPPMRLLTFDSGSVVFALGMAILSGLLIGGLPSLQLLSRNFASALRESSRSSSASKISQRVSSALVCGQISLALVLLVGAGLLMHSFVKIVSRDIGLDPEGVTTLRIPLPGTKYRDDARVVAFKKKILETVLLLFEGHLAQSR